MKRSSLVFGAASTFLLVPATLALANDETVGALPTVKQGVVTGVTAIVVFLIVLAVLATKVWPAISQGLDDRTNKIRSEIEAAEKARKAAADALAQYEQSLAQARAEAAKMIEATKAQQTELANELKAKAEADLALMRERAVKEIQQAKQSAAAELYSEATNLATMVAGKILKREINAQDQQRLVEESLGQLQSMRN
ncbi:MAG: F0F1 ATP synthase subunit B [Planctomycetes bacterium]|nr:F0F1 ATP synthase subunit B [Planctomycetota bacterium]